MMTTPMPAVFFGHGSPMNAIDRNEWTEAWSRMGSVLPRPRAVLMVSAHWYVPGTKVLAVARPRTIHDFQGFPRELSAFEYSAPGDPELAERVCRLLAPTLVSQDHLWGFDHGAWSVLCHLFPQAKVPIVQLSINQTLAPADHYEIGRRLSSLREEGVMIAASGNIVHNLRTLDWSRRDAPAPDWAQRFESAIRQAIEVGDDRKVIEYEQFGEDAHLSVPSAEHFLPLLYVLGARRPGDAVTFPAAGFDFGSLSMLTVQLDSDRAGS